jgi:hypothetical protein
MPPILRPILTRPAFPAIRKLNECQNSHSSHDPAFLDDVKTLLAKWEKHDR